MALVASFKGIKHRMCGHRVGPFASDIRDTKTRRYGYPFPQQIWLFRAAERQHAPTTDFVVLGLMTRMRFINRRGQRDVYIFPGSQVTIEGNAIRSNVKSIMMTT